MKSLFKKIYYRLAAPLWARTMTQIDAVSSAELAERTALKERTRILETEVQTLKKLIEEQSSYISELRSAGLHDMLATHSTNSLRSPRVVLVALSDVAAGMEPSIASQIHDVPADEIIDWVKVLLDRLHQSGSNMFNRSMQTEALPPSGNGFPEIDLLERQIEFNSKSHFDREQASALEIARLRQKLRLEEPSADRIVAGK